MHAIADVPLFLIHETSLNATPKGLVHAEWKDHNDDDVGLPSGYIRPSKYPPRIPPVLPAPH